MKLLKEINGGYNLKTYYKKRGRLTMNFIEFCVSKGYKPFRKMFNTSLKKWEYIESDTNEYCSSSSPGFMDIRLQK